MLYCLASSRPQRLSPWFVMPSLDTYPHSLMEREKYTRDPTSLKLTFTRGGIAILGTGCRSSLISSLWLILVDTMREGSAQEEGRATCVDKGYAK